MHLEILANQSGLKPNMYIVLQSTGLCVFMSSEYLLLRVHIYAFARSHICKRNGPVVLVLREYSSTVFTSLKYVLKLALEKSNFCIIITRHESLMGTLINTVIPVLLTSLLGYYCTRQIFCIFLRADLGRAAY